jgi:hypothetical protein
LRVFNTLELFERKSRCEKKSMGYPLDAVSGVLKRASTLSTLSNAFLSFNLKRANPAGVSKRINICAKFCGTVVQSEESTNQKFD